ncbi:MAG: AAA family ATPase [Halobacteriota archaeon]
MIIKSIKLQNIRSYEDAIIDLPRGVTLFEGESGSGKSSILMSIEFALFGFVEKGMGDALLRKRENRGSVSLIFESDKSEYTIYRPLERAGRYVRQGDGGYIDTPDGRLPLSAADLKVKILEILDFNESASTNAESKIYRYAIFTPQEEMKLILDYNPDARLETLRKALRLEYYKIAIDNATELAKEFKAKAAELEAGADGLETDKTECQDLVKRINGDQQTVQKHQQREVELKQKLADLQTQLNQFHDEQNEAIRIEAIIPELQKQISEKAESINKSEKSLNEAQREQIERNREIKQKKSQGPPTSKSKSELDDELQQREEHYERLKSTRSIIQNRLEDYKKISKDGKCTTCGRLADRSQFAKKSHDESLKSAEVTRKIEESLQEINATRDLITKITEYNDLQEGIASLEAYALTSQQEIDTQKGAIANAKKNIRVEKQRLEEHKRQAKKLSGLTHKLSKLETQKNKSDTELREYQMQIASVETSIKHNQQRKLALGLDIAKKTLKIQNAAILRHHNAWLKNYFVPTVENIETHVLNTYQHEFDQLFQRWLAVLIDDPTKMVTIDRKFTPVLQQSGQDQLMKHLSGGERTSVALAYRLALNVLVRQISSLQPDLLILDEPTDGFDDDQLIKVGDLLSELGCSQTIIVSHQKELESFADQVFSITKKKEGISTIS